MGFKEKLKARALKEEISLSPKQLDQFELFYNMLIETNKSMNLTAITDEDEVIEKHFIDSLSCRRVMDMTKVKTCIDVGTGAGFPGIPLKIAFPQIRLTLLDSLQKRLKFLQEVSDKLELGEIQMLHGRAEDYAKQPEFREHFDLCVSRAVANLSTLSELCLPYVKENGKFIPYKAEKAEAEIEAAQKAVDLLGGEISDKIEFQLPGGDMGRTLVVIDKIKKTPKKYPRKAGTPSKEPLQ
mgnify:CR=1 FL=1